MSKRKTLLGNDSGRQASLNHDAGIGDIVESSLLEEDEVLRPISGPRAPVDAPDGLSFTPGINDAVTGHIEKLSTIMGRLVEEAGGEQYRCPECGSFGPKVSDH